MTATWIALTGLQASSTRLDVAAHNIANVETPNFRRQQAHQEALPEGGVKVSVQQLDAQQPDFAGDVVEQMAAGYAWVANLQVIKVDERNKGTLLDTLA